MNKNELIETVKAMIAAPSCCRELKEAGSKWLAAIGTAEEKSAGAALLTEVREDVCTLDQTIPPFCEVLGISSYSSEFVSSGPTPVAFHSRWNCVVGSSTDIVSAVRFSTTVGLVLS